MNKKFKKSNRERAFNKYNPEKHPLPKVQEIAEEALREVPTHFPGELEELERQARKEARPVEGPTEETPQDAPVEEPPVEEVPVEEPPVEEAPVEQPVEEIPVELPTEEVVEAE